MKQRGHEDCCGNCRWWGVGLTSWHVRAPCTDPDSRCVGWCPPKSKVWSVDIDVGDTIAVLAKQEEVGE